MNKEYVCYMYVKVTSIRVYTHKIANKSKYQSHAKN